ncbi:MAG TPA: transposase [Spirochaetota bacterium]|nr:transposase [Spirochaetota bacterium]HPP04575.1 transposase [Spirochaetota bacterium]
MKRNKKEENRKKLKVRARVEHVFGFIENSMNGSFIRSIGIKRAKFNIGLMNLTYNICRFLFLTRD